MLVFAREAISRGYLVDLVVCIRSGVLEDLVPPGVRVIDLGRQRVSLVLPRLVRYLKDNRPAVLFSTIMHANVTAAIAGRLAGGRTPVIVRESNAPISEPKRTLSRRLTYKMLPRTYKLARAVIAVSEGVAKELRAIDHDLASLVRVIGTPVVSDDMMRLAEQEPAHPWFRPGEVPVILAAARLQAHKGFLALIRAFAVLRRSHEVRLVILGEGPERKNLEAEIARLELRSDVSLPGFFQNPFSFMKRARAFVLSSEYEGLPNVLIQAMAFGTPVVATDCNCGPAEILAGGTYGQLVPVGDVDAMAQALGRALGLPASEQARLSVLQRYSAERVTTEYLRLAGLPERVKAAVPESQERLLVDIASPVEVKE
jgi:glycosyltransferase involved in cell wall biosynthesis